MPGIDAADLERTRALVLQFLEPLTRRDWGRQVPDLEWTCERTLQHMINTELYYAMHLATAATRPLPFPRGPAVASGLNPAEMLTELAAINAVLAAVIRSAPHNARATFAGTQTDSQGILGLACDELLVHTWDIARGLGEAFRGDSRLATRVIGRLFPWAADQADSWSVFLWCNGRTARGERPRLDPDWPRWLAPLEDWDGADPTSSSAPASR